MNISTDGVESELLARCLSSYLAVLQASAEHVVELSTLHSDDPNGDDLFAAWRQANWELLVEAPLHRQVGLTLAVYDGHADWWPRSARVIEFERRASHEVVFRVQRGIGRVGADANRVHRFDGFVDCSSGWPNRVGTLRSVVSEEGGTPACFSLEDVVLSLRPVRPPTSDPSSWGR